MYNRRYPYRRQRPQGKPAIYLVINKNSSCFKPKYIDYLKSELSRAQREFHLIEGENSEKIAAQVRQIVNRHPEGIIACGGDGTVNLVAQHISRRSAILGILPMGKYNNIYRSLYGEPSKEAAARHILSGKARRIDHALIGGKFVLGSFGVGLFPELTEIIKDRGIPRFGITWSRYASQAASRVRQQPVSIKMDAFQFDISPRLLQICLLPVTLGIPLTTSSLDDDGKAEVIFDTANGEAILSSFIRMIYKKKYIYSDEIRIYRGHKILMSPMAGRSVYLDGDIFENKTDSLNIEVFEKKIRIYDDSAKPMKETAFEE